MLNDVGYYCENFFFNELSNISMQMANSFLNFNGLFVFQVIQVLRSCLVFLSYSYYCSAFLCFCLSYLVSK